MRKLKVLLHTDSSLAKTGFGKYARLLLSYLYKTGKYELYHYVCGHNYSHPQLKRTPWESVGCLPDNHAEMEQINRGEEHMKRMAGYGSYMIDKVIQEFKPDVYIGAQDIWAFDGWHRPWWNKITCVIHTTLDSLPILPSALEHADKIKNYWVWATFAEKAMKEKGYHHVKTVRCPMDSSNFYKLPKHKKLALRHEFNIDPDCFIIGDVFRNQLRKSVPNTLEGFAKFKKENPSVKTKLLFHTNLSEGWNIPRQCEEKGVDPKDVLVTYICKKCKKYEVKSFDNRKDPKEELKTQDHDCRFCGGKKTQITVNVVDGVNEKELNEIYNLMDVAVISRTSGGLEIPIYEKKLTEGITLVTNYSCGTDGCLEENGGIPLEWSAYTEHGTEFIKASTSPFSIAKQLKKVYEMKPEKREEMGKKAREWTIKYFDIENVGKQFEEFLDNCPLVEDYDFNFKPQEKFPNAEIPFIEKDEDWIKEIYKKILCMDVNDQDSGFLHWMKKLNEGMTRDQIQQYFRKVAHEENQKNGINNITLDDLLDKEDKKRVLIVMPESIGDVYLSTSLLESIRLRYPKPEWKIYYATNPQFFEILDGNPFIDKVIPYAPEMDSLLLMEGRWDNKGYFDICYLLHVGTQRFLDYMHNGLDKQEVELCT